MKGESIYISLPITGYSEVAQRESAGNKAATA